MSLIDIRGVSHFYKLIPNNSDTEKKTLVFIHGWLLSCNYWYPLIEKLQPHYQCLIYDLKGFGNSQILKSSTKNKQSTYSLNSYAQDLHILLDKLNIKEAWLIGHSLGGSIAIWGADLSKNKIKGVICINAGGGIYLKEEFERFRQAGENVVKFRPNWLFCIPFIDYIFARMMVKQTLSIYWGRQRLIDFLKANEEAAIGSLLESTTEKEVHLLPQIVSRLEQPLYFLGGLEDKIMELKYVEHLASFHHLFKQNHINVFSIENCGHFAMLEQTNMVKEKILGILEKY